MEKKFPDTLFLQNFFASIKMNFPEKFDTMDEKIQELARILDATLAEINPEGLHNGQNGMRIIKFLREFPGFEKSVSASFAKCIDSNLSDDSGNVRRQVKNIYMFPRTNYLPWMRVNFPGDLIDKLGTEVSTKYEFQIKLIHGKIYAVPTSEGVVEHIFTKLNNYVIKTGEKFDDDNAVVNNNESSHITIVNSDVAAKINRNDINTFLAQWSNSFRVLIYDIKSTTSYDWPIFRKCFVAKVEAEQLDKFVQSFNSKFGVNINPSFHITFAIVPRSLWQ